MQLLQQSEATAAQRRIFMTLVDQTDGHTPETGEGSGQPQISKNGAAYANTSATLTHVANGTYYVELTASELDTIGIISVRYDSANTREIQIFAQVVPWDPYDAVRLGATALPNAAAEAAGGLLTRGTSTGQINVDGAGNVKADVTKWLTEDPNSLASGKVDAQASSISVLGAISDAGPTATDFDSAGSDLSSTDDFYNGCKLAFTSGVNKGVSRTITDYTGSTKNFNFAGNVFPAAPSDADTFEVYGG